ncbi:MAG TPA: hypothetical protein VGQ11_09370 [Candidatus Acidoferrales bacterium]|nr:hypothetical protein [Candidatus Acidoferrales bacterium]
MLAITFVLFLPEAFALLSHVVYGNPVQVGIASIHVPSNWIMYRKSGDLTIGRFSRIWVKRIAGAGFSPSMLITKRRGMTFPHDAWREAQRAIKFEAGSIFQREHKVSADFGEGYCLEFSDFKYRKRWRISCEIPPLELHAYFEGSSEFVEQFYEVIQGLKLARTAPTRQTAPPKN